MSSGERPIGAARGKQSDTEALCHPPPPTPSVTPSAPPPRGPSPSLRALHALPPDAQVPCVPRRRTARQRTWVTATRGGPPQAQAPSAVLGPPMSEVVGWGDGRDVCSALLRRGGGAHGAASEALALARLVPPTAPLSLWGGGRGGRSMSPSSLAPVLETREGRGCVARVGPYVRTRVLWRYALRK